MRKCVVNNYCNTLGHIKQMIGCQKDQGGFLCHLHNVRRRNPKALHENLAQIVSHRWKDPAASNCTYSHFCPVSMQRKIKNASGTLHAGSVPKAYGIVFLFCVGCFFFVFFLDIELDVEFTQLLAVDSRWRISHKIGAVLSLREGKAAMWWRTVFESIE